MGINQQQPQYVHGMRVYAGERIKKLPLKDLRAGGPQN